MKIHSLILFIHIATGFSALITGSVAIIASKGKKMHILAGRIYFWSMIGVALSALFLSVSRPNLFLFLISLFSFFLTWSGYKAIRWKNKTLTRLPGIFNKIFIPLFLFTGCIMVLLSLAGLTGISISDERAWLNIVLLIFGIIFSGLAAVELKQWIKPESRNPHWWLYRHIGSMTGSYIAAFTAFLVVNNEFLPEAVAWLAPTVIGSPIISWWIRKYRKRLNREKVFPVNE